MINNIFNPTQARENAAAFGIDLGDLTDEDLIEANEMTRDETNELFEVPVDEDEVSHLPEWWMAGEEDEPPF